MNLYRKKIIVVAVIILFAISVPLTLTIIQQRQDSRSKASAATQLYFSPSSIAKAVGDTIAVDVMIDPGTNMVSYVRFEAKFDPGVLQLSPTTPFVLNTAAFPTQVQNPVISSASGSIKVAVSIGSDLTRPVKTTTKVGTLYFKAINPTHVISSNISFGDITQVLSINPSDGPTENVLSTTTPATLIVATSASELTPTINATPSPTATASTMPTATPSAQPTGPTATPSATIIPPLIASPSPTLDPVTINLNVILHAIGAGGDNVNPTGNSFSNKNPVHATRSAQIAVYNETNQLIGSTSGVISYSSASGSFVGQLTLPRPTSTGVFSMRISTDYHLTRRLPGFISLSNPTVTLPAIQFITGDANQDNRLNIIDYNLLSECYGEANSTCNDEKKVATDFNDDGEVNQVDYNLFLRELSQSFGD